MEKERERLWVGQHWQCDVHTLVTICGAVMELLRGKELALRTSSIYQQSLSHWVVWLNTEVVVVVVVVCCEASWMCVGAPSSKTQPKCAVPAAKTEAN